MAIPRSSESHLPRLFRASKNPRGLKIGLVAKSNKASVVESGVTVQRSRCVGASRKLKHGSIISKSMAPPRDAATAASEDSPLALGRLSEASAIPSCARNISEPEASDNVRRMEYVSQAFEEKEQWVITHYVVSYSVVHCVSPSSPSRSRRTMLNKPQVGKSLRNPAELIGFEFIDSIPTKARGEPT